MLIIIIISNDNNDNSNGNDNNNNDKISINNNSDNEILDNDKDNLSLRVNGNLHFRMALTTQRLTLRLLRSLLVTFVLPTLPQWVILKRTSSEP